MSRFTLVRSDDLFLLHLLSLTCTILRPSSMTPGIACDSKSPMTDRPGPLVRPRFSVRYLANSRAWPSPLWAYNAFSDVLSLSFLFASSPCSIPFRSILFHYAADLIYFYSVLFDSLLASSLLFSTILSLARDRRISLYINHCTI